MKEFQRRALFVAGLALAVVIVTIGFRFVAQTFLIVFAGLLLSVALAGPSDWLSEHTPLGRSPALALVTVTTLVVLFGGAPLFGYQIADQADPLTRGLGRRPRPHEDALRGGRAERFDGWR